MIALLDTHTVIWSLTDDARLGISARELIDQAKEAELAISDMTLLEISMLAKKGRIQLSGPIAGLLKDIASQFRVLPINAEIAADAMELEIPQADPFDRVIVATARKYRIDLLTKDRNIVNAQSVSTVW